MKKKKGRRRRKEGEEEDEKGDGLLLDVFARFATGSEHLSLASYSHGPCRTMRNLTHAFFRLGKPRDQCYSHCLTAHLLPSTALLQSKQTRDQTCPISTAIVERWRRVTNEVYLQCT